MVSACTCIGQRYLYRSEVLVLVSSTCIGERNLYWSELVLVLVRNTWSEAQLVAVATSQKTRMDEFDQGDVLSHTAADTFYLYLCLCICVCVLVL